jgi:nitroreductase
MEVMEAIHGRHVVPRVKPDPVARAVIEKLLQAAVQAPNHYKVRPWRFVVLTGRGRQRLGDVMAVSFREKNPEVSDEAVEKVRLLPLRAPVVITAAVDKPAEPKVSQIENVAAVAAACQNILLAAHAQGLGVQWRTGEWALDPRVKAFLGFAEDQILISFLYVGFPEVPIEPYERPSFEDRTVWLE